MRHLATELVHLLMQWPLWIVLLMWLRAGSWWRVGARRAALAAAGGAVLLHVASMPATSQAALLGLERAWPLLSPAQVHAALGPPSVNGPHLLVLSAGWIRHDEEGPHIVMGGPSWERTAAAVTLWREVGGTLYFTGAPLPDGSDSVARHMLDAARSMGVPADHLRLEERSISTRENLVNSRDRFGLAGRRDVVLVTSGLHMTRAMAAASGVGLTPLPYPCDRRVDARRPWTHWLPDNEGPPALEEALHEWLGLLAYRLRGWT